MVQQTTHDAATGSVAPPKNDFSDITKALIEVVGSEYVLTSEADRDYYSRDLSYMSYHTAAVVIQPGSAQELQTTVQVAVKAGYAVIPRGGGMSYTLGYTPEREQTVLVNMLRLDQVVGSLA